MSTQGPWYNDVAIPALLRHARNTYGSAMRRALAAAGYDDIPRNGLYVIGGLALEQGVAIGELVGELGVSKQAAGQLVDTLVLRGYLDRQTDASDRRKLIVTLTDRGRAAAEVQRQAREAIDADLAAAVGSDTVRALRRGLGALIGIGSKAEDGAAG
jgi:DNA-binding MarR family transcriptional regulator